MFDNITVNDRGQVLLNEDVGNPAYLGGVWLYDTTSGSLVEIAHHDPTRFTPGAAGVGCQKSASPVSSGNAPWPAKVHDDQPCPYACST
jgi:hypothetical protein